MGFPEQELVMIVVLSGVIVSGEHPELGFMVYRGINGDSAQNLACGPSVITHQICIYDIRCTT